MSILRSFNIGVSGLRAAGSGMGVIGDNISNAGTNGFKSSRAEFQDVLATSLKGIDGGDQMGAGVRLAHIKPVMSQGDVTRTESITDLAINGNGFFMVEAGFGRGYTRDGSLNFDKGGQLVTGDSFPVLGFGADDKGKITNKIEPIKLGNTTINAKATEEVAISMNLDSRENIGKFDLANAEKTASYSSTMTVYDNIGTARLITIYYNKGDNNSWEYHAVADGKDTQGGKEGQLYEMATGKLVFNDKGLLQEEVEGKNAFNFNKGAAQGQKIKFDWGKSIKEGGEGMDASTQFGSKSTVARHTQNGHTAATLTSLSFNDNGILTAVYDNGESRDIAQIAVGKFENNEGLFKVGKNLFKESKLSGQAAIGKPGEGGRGEVLSKSLELSNVDLAAEFVAMMGTQRNFTANAKTLTAADQMLQEVLGIKR
ncbi:MAG: flagellar hook protein FlgE [Bdellovibrio sp.]|nr:flagellar hook protein FlgE [Bdellovibrio sp.]